MAGLPDGFLYRPEFLTPTAEADLIALIASLDFHEFQMHGVTARRRVVQFGWHYSFNSFRLAPAPAIPEEFSAVRDMAADLAGVTPDQFSEVLVTEYKPGAGIGWHRDAPPFGVIAGISLAGSCRMRFQRGKDAARETAAVELEPRSAYVLSGSARTEWQHSIPPTKALRYSITFRTLRKSAGQPSPAQPQALS